MKHFKFLSVASLALLFALPHTAAMAESYPVLKTELVNVAECKPIVSSHPHTHTIEGWEITNLTDGDRSTFTVSEFGPDVAGQESFTIDLLRRCKVEKIEVFDRYDYDVSTGRANFDIIGANNEDFSDAVTLGSLGSTDDVLFPHGGAYTIELDSKDAYRYIKFQKTAPGDYQYAEIKVWANQTVTDIARGTKADKIITDALNDNSHWVYDFAPPEAAFDGETATFWLEDGSAYRYYRVDLGKPYHIGMIEMTPRDMSADGSVGDIWGKKYIKLYGSNTDATDNTIFDPYSAPPTDAEAEVLGFKKLAQVGADNPVDGDMVFPSIWVPQGTEDVNGNPGKFQATVDDTEAYRYITYKHYMSLGASLSTFSLYVVHPEVNSAEIAGDTVYVNFSDEMDTSTLNEDSVTVFVGDEQLAVDVEFPDAYTMMLKLDKTYFDSKIKVVISEEAQNMKEVGLANETTLNLISPPAIEVREFRIQDKKEGEGNEITSLEGVTEAGSYITVKNNMSDKSEDIIVLMVLFDQNNTVTKVNEVRATLLPLAEPTSIVCGFDIEDGENCRLATFIWKDYDLMKPWVNHKEIR